MADFLVSGFLMLLFVAWVYSLYENQKTKAMRRQQALSARARRGAQTRARNRALAQGKTYAQASQIAGFYSPIRKHSDQQFEYTGIEDGRGSVYTYLLVNIERGWVKVGTGMSGRVRQYFESMLHETGDPLGHQWRVLAIGQFLTPEDAKNAEARVLHYWRNICRVPAAAGRGDFGVVSMKEPAGGLVLVPIYGESETALRGAVCEHCALTIIQQSPGFLRVAPTEHPTTEPLQVNCTKINDFVAPPPLTPSWPSREPKPQDPILASKKELSLGEFIESRLDPNRKNDECWEWPDMKVNGYGAISWNYDVIIVHRELHTQIHGSVPDKMWSTCGLRACVNPAHWQTYEEKWLSGRLCITPGCDTPVKQAALCDACKTRRKRRRRAAAAINAIPECLSNRCIRPAEGSSRWGFCVPCRNQMSDEALELDMPERI